MQFFRLIANINSKESRGNIMIEIQVKFIEYPKFKYTCFVFIYE